MRLGLNLGSETAWTAPADLIAYAREAERLGYAVVWAAEAYGFDASSMLAWIAAQTATIDLGSAVMQVPARSPAATAMTAATVDAISGGRFRLGLGVSGPQIAEGVHGESFARPLARTREYVDIVRLALDGQPVAYPGQHYRLPRPGGSGKTLRLSYRPPRERVPVYLAAVGPRSVELAGEIADGWLSVLFAPGLTENLLAALAAGRARAGRSMTGFDVVPSVPAVVGNDVAACAERVRWYVALLIGGMGSRTENYYNRLVTSMGYGAAAREIQDLYLDGRQREAAAAVPLELIDRTSLLGPKDRIADRLQEYAAAGVTTLSVRLSSGAIQERMATLRTVAEAVEVAGVG